MTAGNIRQAAREALRGKWGKLYLPFLLYLLFSYAFALPELLEYLFPDTWHILRLLELAMQILAYWVLIGTYRICSAVLEDKPFSAGMLFRRTHLGAGLLMGAINIAISKANSLLMGLELELPIWSSLVYMLLVCAVDLVGIWAMLRISPGFYLLATDGSLRFSAAVSFSWCMMRGNVRRVFGMALSFIGWFILAGLASAGISRICTLAFGDFGAVPARLIFSAVSVPLNIYIRMAQTILFRDIFQKKGSS